MRMVLVALIVLISTTTHAFGQDSDWEANNYGQTIGWGIGCGCIEHDESTVNNLLEKLYPQFSKKQIQSMKGYIAYGIKSAGRYDNSQQICSSLCFGSNRNEYIQKFNAAVKSYLTDPATPSTSKLQSDNKIIAFRDCSECPEMVVIPAGSFVMGSPAREEKRAGDEGPQRTVTIRRPFAVGRYEVMFREWNSCVADGDCINQQRESLESDSAQCPVFAPVYR